MNSAEGCGASCVTQLIQVSQDATQSARYAAEITGEAVTSIEGVNLLIQGIDSKITNLESQTLQVRIDIDSLRGDIDILRSSVDNSMVPTVDDNLLSLVIVILSAFTLCLISCIKVISYTSHLESKKEERRRIIVQQKKSQNS